MKVRVHICFCLLIVIGQFVLSPSAMAAWKADKKIELSGPAGAFDFMTADDKNDRIIAAHKMAGTLEVLDLETGLALGHVKLGHALGTAVDFSQNLYLVGNDDEKSVAFVDAVSFKVTSRIQLDGPVDALTIDTKRHHLFAAEDSGKKIWVIDLQTAKVLTTVQIPGMPEVLEYDSKTDKVYLNIKDKNAVVRIDPEQNKVDATWSTLPATGPHGLVLDSKRRRLFSAGKNGKLVALDLKTGQVLKSVEIAPGTDQIALDRVSQTLFCAAKEFISIVDVSGVELRLIQSVASAKGAHTLAVDQRRHDVWISYADQKHSYLQRYRQLK